MKCGRAGRRRARWLDGTPGCWRPIPPRACRRGDQKLLQSTHSTESKETGPGESVCCCAGALCTVGRPGVGSSASAAPYDRTRGRTPTDSAGLASMIAYWRGSTGGGGTGGGT